MRRLLSVAFLFGSLAAAPGARANEVPMLSRVPHKVAIRSFRAAQPHERNEAMHIAVTEGHPGSKVLVQRQRRSAVAEISGEVTDAQLRTIAEKVSQWKDHMTFTTKNVSQKTPHNELHRDNAIVMRPNSRFRVLVETRDGQAVDGPGGIVGGHSGLTEQHINAPGTGSDTLTFAGSNMKSARAWAVHENIYVSAPETNPAQVKTGEAKLELAKEKAAQLEKMTYDFNATKAQMPAPQQTETQNAITALTAEKTKLEQEGNKEIAEGNRSMVKIVSVGGLPIATQTVASNTRLAEENPQAKHGLNVTSSPESGYLHEELEALPHDEVKLSVSFTNNNSQISQHHVHFEVPTGADKPAFTMGGKKFYRINVVKSQQYNADPAF